MPDRGILKSNYTLPIDCYIPTKKSEAAQHQLTFQSRIESGYSDPDIRIQAPHDGIEKFTVSVFILHTENFFEIIPPDTGR